MKRLFFLLGLLILIIRFVPTYAVDFQAEIENVPINLITIYNVPFDVTFNIYNPVSDPISNAGGVDEYGDPIGSVTLSELKDQIHWTFDPPCSWVTDDLTHTVSFYLEDDTQGYVYPDVALYTSTLTVTAGEAPIISGDCGMTLPAPLGHTATAKFEVLDLSSGAISWTYSASVLVQPNNGQTITWPHGDIEMHDNIFSFRPCPLDYGAVYEFNITATDCIGRYDQCNFIQELGAGCWSYHDPNGDGNIDILDIVFIINYKYKDGPAPEYPPSADWDLDGAINILDVVSLINFKYKDGPFAKHDLSHCSK